MFRAAIVGHSHVPSTLEVKVPAFDQAGKPTEEALPVDIYRSPGATAEDFFWNNTLSAIFEYQYQLIILWIGSNDIHDSVEVRDLVHHISRIVKALETHCKADVRFCLIEPRAVERSPRTNIQEQETYNKIAKGVNRKLQGRVLRGRRFISFGAKPFCQDLGRDGVHFRHSERESFVYSKLRHCINYAYTDFQRWKMWGEPIPLNVQREKEAAVGHPPAGN